MAKEKLLRIMEILRQETDNLHPMKTNALCKRLAEYGIKCDRRVLAKDILILVNHGFPVKTVTVAHSKAYYTEQEEFSTAEIKTLMDAVQAAVFIPKDLTNHLIEKLLNLNSGMKAINIRDNLVIFNTRKTQNEEVMTNIEIIESSLLKQKQVSFLYFKHDENRQRVYQRNKETYIVEPIALIYENDKYYLHCYNEAHGGKRNYRIDRMENVQLLETYISNNALVSAEDLASYTSRTFKMFGGEEYDALIEFDESLIDVMYDKFGMNIDMMRISDTHLVTNVKIQKSGTFWGWFYQFPDKMKILKPQSLADECKAWGLKAQVDWDVEYNNI